MDSQSKDSYRIGRILKKLTGIKFLKSRQSQDISEAAIKKYRARYSKASGISKSKKPTKPPVKSHTDKYVQYQKELEAARLLGSDEKPRPPGKILKLPTGRRELMSKDEE